MKLWNRIKYRLLCWLLNDICKGSDCDTCVLDWRECFVSSKSDIYVQARKAWRIE